MGFNVPGPNFEKKKELTPEFLEKQINLMPTERNSDFRDYVQNKIDNVELEQLSREKKTKEELLEDSFQRQIKWLGFSEKDLKDKKILDLGSGDGEFVEYCLKNEITKEIYGIDLYLDEHDVNEKFKDHFFQGSFVDELPVEEVDIIVSSGAVSLVISGGEEVLLLENILENAIKSIKDDGEIRICPIAKPARGEDLSGLELSFAKWQELLEELSQKQNFKWRFEPNDIRVIGTKNEIVFDYTLVIKKSKLIHENKNMNEMEKPEEAKSKMRPQYEGLSSEIVDELWNDAIPTDPEQAKKNAKEKAESIAELREKEGFESEQKVDEIREGIERLEDDEMTKEMNASIEGSEFSVEEMEIELEKLTEDFHFILHQTYNDSADRIINAGEYFGYSGLEGTSLINSNVGDILATFEQLDKPPSKRDRITHKGANSLIIMAFPKNLVDVDMPSRTLSKIDALLIDKFMNGEIKQFGLPNQFVLGYYHKGVFHKNEKFNPEF